MRLTRAAGVVVAALGLASCSQEPSDPPQPVTTVEETLTTTQTAEPEPGTAQVRTADGEKVVIPADLADAMEEFGEGEALKVEQLPDGWIASYDGGQYVTWNERTGGAPTRGAIARKWIEGKQEVGFPLALESELPDPPGWKQDFERGSIEWRPDGG